MRAEEEFPHRLMHDWDDGKHFNNVKQLYVLVAVIP